MKVKFFLIGILILVFGLVGCGTTSTIKPEGTLKSMEAIPKLAFNSIKIEVKTEVQDSAEEAQQLKEFLVKEFKARNKEIKDFGSDAEMLVVIKHLKKVSRGSRLWWGSLAGKAEVKLDVLLTNNIQSINFSVDTTSAGASSVGGWLSGYGGATEDALERTASKIAVEVF